MLSLSSLRRIAHSTSLRASGSLMVFCRSPAWEILPLRAAAIASLTAARSTERSEEHTSELQSQSNLVCRLLLEKKKKKQNHSRINMHDRTNNQMITISSP